MVVGSPNEGEQLRTGEEAKLTNPEAAKAREVSATAYEGLGSQAAEKLAGEAFPVLVEEAAGGPPTLPQGQSITGYVNADSAQLDLGGGEHGIVASTVPMAVEGPAGSWAPIDLGLREVGGAVEPVNPLVAVRLSKHLSEGAQLSSFGLSLTPVGANGSQLGGAEGEIDGTGVFFANTETDADTVVKPSTFGFSVDTLLRSARSPEQISFRVGMPTGASLVQARNGSGTVEVVKEGVTIAAMPASSGRDAAGSHVPVSVSISGDVLTLRVARQPDQYLYPIDVDPEFNLLTESKLNGTDWKLTKSEGSEFGEYEVGELELQTTNYSEGQWGALNYVTNGDSKIYELGVVSHVEPNEVKSGELVLETGEDFVEFAHKGAQENRVVVAQHGVAHKEKIEGPWCPAEPACLPEGAGANNTVRLESLATGSGSTGMSWRVKSATVSIAQPKETHSTVSANTESSKIEYTSGGKKVEAVNVLHGSGAWLGPSSGAFEYEVKDAGLGVSDAVLTDMTNGDTQWEHNYLTGGSCVGVQCAETEHQAFSYSGMTWPLPNGVDTLRMRARDPMEGSWSPEHGEGEVTVKVDHTPPGDFTLSGVPDKYEGGGYAYELGEVTAHLKVEATDGEGSVPSSGVKSITLYIDEKEVGKPSGSCTVPTGACTATGEWTINGRELGAGRHTLTVVATDNAENVETKTYTLNVYAASPVGMGPGSVNPESGDFALGATDVNLSGGLGALTVARHYDSLNLTEGAEGPLGPQWAVSLGSLASLEVLANKGVMVVGPEGLTYFSPKEGGGFQAPEGDTTLVLEYKAEYEGKEPAYLLKNESKGATTVFRLPKGAKSWMPTVSKGRVATNTTTDEYKSVEVNSATIIIEPTLELAPHPAATCGSEELEKLEIAAKGCRALKFVYAEKTKESIGENEGQWGEYKNRLMEVIAFAYNPSSEAMEKTPMAKYEYDALGRLRAVWNPQISPALKTVYGYDTEGHVTAITAPGEESWALTYGTIAGDASTGRLLKVAQGPVSEPLWSGEPPQSSKPPTLAGTPSIGHRMMVSGGGWSANPFAYAYQWEDCNSSGAECTAILGATNAHYIVTASDLGHTLVALMTATNGGGSVRAASAHSAVASAEGGTVADYLSEFRKGGPGRSGEFEYVSGVAVSPKGTIWVTDEDEGLGPTQHLYEYNEKDELLRALGSWGSGNGELKHPEAVTVDAKGEVWVDDAGNNRIEIFGENGEYKSVITGVTGNVVASKGHVWVGEKEYSEEGTFVKEVKGVAGGAGAGAIDSKGDFWVLSKSTSSPRVTEYNEEGKEVQHFGSYGSGHGQFEEPAAITVGAEGDVWVVDTGNSRVEEFNEKGEYAGQFGSYGLGEHDEGGEGLFSKFGWTLANGITTDPKGNIYVTDNGWVEKWTPANGNLEETPQPGATIEYGVPLEGTGAPQQMGINSEGKPEPAKWGQTDDPEYATAIFPPDEPQSWPTSDYRRASTYYFDGHARTVNVASPSGGVATTEYNEYNDVKRTLSTANRATALEAGTKSAEVAALMDTESVYSQEGTQLAETLGPQHTVKIVHGNEKVKSGSEVLARNHIKYHYDEGAPGGETYDLVTKTTDGAETTGKEELDVRTSTTSYSGQNNLGWKLREPTSVTTDPEGLKLTSTTVYEKETGDIIEAKSPAGQREAATYTAEFRKGGPGRSGEFEYVSGVAVSPKGTIWVTDEDEGLGPTQHLYEYNEKDELLRALGSWGSGNGELKHPEAVTVDAKGEVWVDDAGNNRIEIFGENGEYKSVITGVTGNVVASKGHVWVGEKEYSEEGTFVKEVKGVAGGAGAGAIDSKGDFWVLSKSTSSPRVTEYNEEGKEVQHFGSYGSGHGQFEEPAAITVGAEGDVWVVDTGNSRVEEFNEKGEYAGQFGSYGLGEHDEGGEGLFSKFGWTLANGITTDPKGNIYVTDNGWVEKWTGTGSPAAHDTHTTYYSAEANPEDPACGKHIEWVGLPCQTAPVAQPGDALPSLPTTTVSYNTWEQPETVTETFGSQTGAPTRTKKTTYDSAGRPLTSEVTSTSDTPVSAVTDHYSTTTGALIKQSNTVEGEEKATSSIYNTRGQLTEYTDAEGAITTYSYDADGRATEVNTSSAAHESRGKQNYTYDETTGFLTKLVDSGAGTFTAIYNSAGQMLNESYPNKMTATYTRNSLGDTTGVEYTKTSHCASTCPETWFSDTVVPSIHGETLKQTNSLSEEPNYTYDAAGRLTEVQEIPAGKGCKTRSYAYDEESSRTSLISREPNSKGECASEGGITEAHTYDSADRLTDTGVAYETFGNTTKLPAADSGGTGMEIISSYYVDNQVATQKQNEELLKYTYDSGGRTMKTTSENEKTKAKETVVSHYASAGGAPVWTSESEGKWTRDIPGLDGDLTGTQTSNGTIVLMLHDLQGNVVGTAALGETETKLLTKYNSTEFGVPVNGTPPTKYSWLGAAGIASESPSGLVTQDGTTYVPQTGRPLETQGTRVPAPEDAAAAYVMTLAPWVIEGTAAVAQQLTNAEQAQKALEAANTPAGETPFTPPSWWCGGEYGPCEGEGTGQSLEESFNGSGGGTGASAAGANPCKLGLIFGEASPQELFAGGWFSCNKDMRGFELETCILWEGPSNEGPWSNLECNEEHGHRGQVFSGQSSGKGWVKDELCPIGLHFFGWVWGEVLGSGGFQLKPMQAKAITCTGNGSENFYDAVKDFKDGILPELPDA